MKHLDQMHPQQYGNRIAWIDNVKMLAMLFVIFGHTSLVLHTSLPSWLNLFIMSFNMALFVMMTGYTSVNTIDKICNLKLLCNYIFKITKRILVPAVVFSAAMNSIFLIIKFIVSNDIDAFDLYMRFAIVVVYVTTYFVRKKKNWSYFFKFLCLISIPLAILTSAFWFLTMIWCVCAAAAIASYITIVLGRPGGGYFCDVLNFFFVVIDIGLGLC